LPRDPSFNEADVSDKPEWVRALPPIGKQRVQSITANYRNRLGSLAAVDEGIRAVVRAVDAAGELDRTVFVFTSDNGYAQGEHRFPSGKSVVYEPSIRVPFFVTGPGFRQWRVRSPITFADVARRSPAGGTTPPAPVDGRPLQETIARPNADRAVPVASGLDTELGQPVRGGPDGALAVRALPATGESELHDLQRPYELHSRQGDPKLRGASSSNGSSTGSSVAERLPVPVARACRECGPLIGIWHHRGGSSS
jgi:arylsulfatase A-like enzyme